MRKCIFIRSYHKDVEWLKNCLASIEKNFTGIDELVLCYPEGQADHFKDITFTKFPFKVVTCRSYDNDYLGQQISKLRAFDHTDCDMIMFFDSDCIFTAPVDFDYYLDNGKPVIYKDLWSDLPKDAHIWQSVTQHLLTFPMEFEYMRCFPFVYYRQTLINIYTKYFKSGFDLDAYIVSKETFSEFNLMGAMAEHYEADLYSIKIGKLIDRPLYIKQYWSHDPLPNETND